METAAEATKGIVLRTPTVIAQEIRSLQAQARYMMLLHAVEIGRRLVEAKQLLAHGAWGTWLETAVEYSQRTAQNFMRIYEEYGDKVSELAGTGPRTRLPANISFSQAVALLGLPPEERETFVAEHDMSKMSVREIQEAIRQRDEAIRERDAAREEYNKTRQALEQAEKELDTSRSLVDHMTGEMQIAKNEISRLQGELNKAKAAGKSSEEVAKLQKQLAAAQAKVKELSEKPPQPAEPVVVEKVPDEVKQEIEDLKSRNKALQVKLDQVSNGAIMKYNVYFEALNSNFNGLLGALAEIGGNDAEAYAKYKGITNKLLDKMRERI